MVYECVDYLMYWCIIITISFGATSFVRKDITTIWIRILQDSYLERSSMGLLLYGCMSYGRVDNPFGCTSTLINSFGLLKCGLILRFTHQIRNRYGLKKRFCTKVREDVPFFVFSFMFWVLNGNIWNTYTYTRSTVSSILHSIKQLPMQIRFVLWSWFLE